MKTSIAVALGCLLLAACDYTVPLVTSPEMDADPALIGRWEQAKEHGNKDTLLVLPLDGREYLVVYPSSSDDAMYARACLCRCAGRTLVQLKWFGTAAAALPDDPRVYQFAAYEIQGKELTVRLLNTSTVDKETSTTEALIAAITAAAEDEELFGEPMKFTRVSEAAGN